MNIPAKDDLKKALNARIGENLSKKLENTTVAVCGLGGLGSNIAVSLVRAGIGKLILADFDRVDITNLNRQQYTVDDIGRYKTEALSRYLKHISPYINICAYTEKMNINNYERILKNADIVCEAFDRAEEKSKICDYVLENMPEKYLVCASGMAGLESANNIKTKRITKRFYVCGDGISDVSEDSLFSTRVMLCAAHQAHTVLRIISGQYEV